MVGGKWLNRVVTGKEIVDVVMELLGASYLWHVSYCYLANRSRAMLRLFHHFMMVKAKAGNRLAT